MESKLGIKNEESIRGALYARLSSDKYLAYEGKTIILEKLPFICQRGLLATRRTRPRYTPTSLIRLKNTFAGLVCKVIIRFLDAFSQRSLGEQCGGNGASGIPEELPDDPGMRISVGVGEDARRSRECNISLCGATGAVNRGQTQRLLRGSALLGLKRAGPNREAELSAGLYPHLPARGTGDYRKQQVRVQSKYDLDKVSLSSGRGDGTSGPVEVHFRMVRTCAEATPNMFNCETGRFFVTFLIIHFINKIYTYIY